MQTEISFDAPQSSQETSRAAYRSVKNVSSKQRRILNVLTLGGSMSDEQIYVCLCSGEISPSGARSRRAELVTMGLVKDSGRRTKTASGRDSVIWEAC